MRICTAAMYAARDGAPSTDLARWQRDRRQPAAKLWRVQYTSRPILKSPASCFITPSRGSRSNDRNYQFYCRRMRMVPQGDRRTAPIDRGGPYNWMVADSIAVSNIFAFWLAVWRISRRDHAIRETRCQQPGHASSARAATAAPLLGVIDQSISASSRLTGLSASAPSVCQRQ